MTFRGSIFFRVRDYLNLMDYKPTSDKKWHLKITVGIRRSKRNIHFHIGPEHITIYYYCGSLKDLSEGEQRYILRELHYMNDEGDYAYFTVDIMDDIYVIARIPTIVLNFDIFSIFLGSVIKMARKYIDKFERKEKNLSKDKNRLTT